MVSIGTRAERLADAGDRFAAIERAGGVVLLGDRFVAYNAVNGAVSLRPDALRGSNAIAVLANDPASIAGLALAKGVGAAGQRPAVHGTGYKRPNSAAVSDIRLENPHSLSYHPITRASAPSTTAVCVESNVQDAGLWLKSMLTSGALL